MTYNSRWGMALEPRLMFDGAAVSTVAESLADAAAQKTAEPQADSAPAPAVAAPEPARREVAFVDASLADAQSLIQALPAGTEVVTLQAGQDGLAQMAAWAETHSGYDAIHILSHGSDGHLVLNGQSIGAADLAAPTARDELAAVGRALKSDGDLLLYGCDIAADAAGRDFIAALAQATGADVAASADATGAARLGGDWDLEAKAGEVETAAIHADAYDHLLTSLSGMEVVIYNVADAGNPYETTTVGSGIEFNWGTTYDIDSTLNRLTITFSGAGDGFTDEAFAFKFTSGGGNPTFTSFTYNDALTTVSAAFKTNLTPSFSGNVLTLSQSDNTVQVGVAGSSVVFDFTVSSGGPTVASVAVPANSTYLASQNLDFTVNFSEAVTVATAGGTPRLAIDVGGTTKYATYQSGTGSTALVFRYTVESGLTDVDGITVSELQANGGTIKSGSAADAALTLNSVGATASVLVDSVAPAVTSVSVPSNATYIAGQNLDFTVNFGEDVTVNTGGGTPRLALDIGGTTKYATYQSGTGTGALVFRYTVESGLTDADGITVSELQANGGTLKDAATNDATLTLNSVGATTSVLVDSTAPTLSSSTPADNATGISSSANIVLNFNENVAKGTGNIVIKKTSDHSVIETIDVAGGLVTVNNAQVTINPNTTLTDSTEYYVVVDGGAITDTHNNSYAGISSTTALSFTTTDTTAPTLSSSTPADNAAGISTTANIVLNFNENVAKGTGNIVIKKTSDNSTVETIDVTSGLVTVSNAQVTINPNATLAFGTEYYVQFNAGAIKDTSNNDYAGIADTTSLSFTTGGPSVIGVSGTSGSYKAGDTVDITVTFESTVDVVTTGGTPTLALADGGSAGYLSGTGTTALVFRYTVGAGATAADLDYTATSSLALNGGTITAAGGSTAAVLTLAAPGAAGSLGNAQNIVIDTTAPRVTSVDRQTPAGSTTNADTLVWRVTFNGAVQNLDTTDFAVSGTTATVTNVASAGGNSYDVTASGGDLASFNGTVTLSFAGGQNVADGAGNALNATPTGTNNPSYLVDNTAPRVASIDRQTPSGTTANAVSLVFRVTFDGAVSNVDATDFTVGGTTATVTNVASAGGNAYDVTVSGGNLASLDGMVTLAFAGGQNIADSATNNMTNTTPTDTDNHTYTLDNSAPKAPTLTASGGTSTTVAVTGTAEANSTVKVYDGTTLLGTTATDGTGAWSYIATLTEGRHNLKATATDGTGNTSTASAAVSVTVTLPTTTNNNNNNNSSSSGDVGGVTPSVPTTTSTSDAGTSGLQTIVRADAGAGGTTGVVGMGRGFGLSDSTGGAGAGISTGTISAGGGGSGNVAVGVTAIIPAVTTVSTGNAFAVAVAVKAAGAPDALVVNQRIADTVISEGSRLSVTIPTAAFADTKADARVTLVATRADGAALPAWMVFNPQTGTFEGQPPPGFKGEVVVRVIARDNEGREAVQSFKIQVGDADQGNVAPQDEGRPQPQTPAPGQTGDAGHAIRHAAARPVGKPALSAQMKAMSFEGRMAKQMALFNTIKHGGKVA